MMVSFAIVMSEDTLKLVLLQAVQWHVWYAARMAPDVLSGERLALAAAARASASERRASLGE